MQLSTLPQRAALAGHELTMVVLAATPEGCMGIDLDSGALVRASVPGLWTEPVSPYEVVTATMADPAELVFDPAQPEAVLLEGAPQVVGRLPGRRIDRLLRLLRHPRHGQLLGWAGPAILYWTLEGDHPSAALLDLTIDPVVLSRAPAPGRPEGPRCRFSWAGRTLEFPITDRRLTAALRRSELPILSGSALTDAVGGRPRYLLVALTPPVNGHCYKVVAAVLPRP
jgi:hypothetical protein